MNSHVVEGNLLSAIEQNITYLVYSLEIILIFDPRHVTIIKVVQSSQNDNENEAKERELEVKKKYLLSHIPRIEAKRVEKTETGIE
jgi:hypothetical protein